MAGQDIAVKLEERTVLRKGLQKLRAAGQIPAVVHDHGKPSTHVSGDFRMLTRIYQEAGKHHPVQLDMGGKPQLAMIKDVDFDPAKHQMRHIVFQSIKQNETVTADIPVVIDGEVPAEKLSLMVITTLDTVEVEALPQNLPDQLTVDAAKLVEVGDKLSVADITAPEGVTIITEPEQTIAYVEMPKDQIAEADAAQASLADDAGTTEDAAPAAEGDETPAETPETAE